MRGFEWPRKAHGGLCASVVKAMLGLLRAK